MQFASIAIGLYVALSRELGDPVAWHGTSTKDYAFETFSSAFLNASLEEYCALTPSCGNEAFKAANGDLATRTSAQSLSYEIARSSGVKKHE
ncbi:hypothetical protein N7492_005573 [Penicillium capsulatum]|uniref:Uncharacterized protein n=1 Tax=Penicillium capsulatum TaxID=69766 RepID=A0A9W9I9U0_9EURO|nr:hypothetical protein N7492_005573 [Penicillium capsulatum]